MAALTLVLATLVAAAVSAGTDWTEIGRANFDDVQDGAGDGKSLPAAIGTITTLAPTGKSLKEVAPFAGIQGGRLLLSDAGAPGQCEFGFEFAPSREAVSAVLIAFDVSQRCEGNKFGIEVADHARTDSSCSGGVDDGATTELCTIDVEGGNLRVNGHAMKLRLAKGTPFRVEIGLFDVLSGDDFFQVTVTNVDSGESETVSDLLVDGYRPVRAVDFLKRGGHAGEVAFDNLSILAPAK